MNNEKASMRTDEELREAIGKITWFHSLELRPGIITPGCNNERFTLPLLQLPADLTGKTVLDIGCWDGYYSFECERRGAKRVVATDVYEGPASRAGFDLAREELGSSAELAEVSVYDLPDMLDGEQFDLVLFLGVLYHLRHPWLGLEKVAACTKPGGIAIIDTIVDRDSLFDRPLMAFCPDNKVKDESNTWWAPNISAVAAMLATCGFASSISVVQVFGGDRTIFHALKSQSR